MKLKYLLASGLFLSTAFVACTNDDFAEISAPVNTDGAIALGEGFTIEVNKGGVDTRAAFDAKYTPYWEKDDQLGAAWVHMVTEVEEKDGVYTATQVSPVGSSSDKFYSNHPFNLIEGENTNDGKFESVTNAFAGAYVLYYPYDPSVAMTGEEIPVAIKTYEADCAEPLKNISENMFSYSPASFVPGGPRTGKFTLKQVPVLVRLQFAVSKKLNMNLADGITIQNIVIEASDDDGNTVLAKTGTLKPNDAEIKTLGTDNYNGLNNKNLNGIVAYSNEESAENIFVTLKNSDTDKYKLLKEEVATEGEFVFSMLPLSDKADEVTVKVVTDKGVFATTYPTTIGAGATAEEVKASQEWLNRFNEGVGKNTGVADLTKGEQGGAAYEGGQISLGVMLDATVNDDVIYTVDEFNKRWAAAIKSGKPETLVIGTPLELTEALACDNNNANVTITGTGASLTVPSVNLTHANNLVFDNEIIVEGDVYSSGDVPVTFSKLSAENVNIEGKATIGANEIGKLTVAADGDVTLAAFTGATANDEATVSSIVINGNSTDAGTLTLTPTNLTIEAMDATKGTVNLNENMTNEGTITLGAVTLASGKKFINNGTVTLNGAFTGEFENNAGATLNINADVDAMTLTNKAADATNGKAAGIVNIAAEVELEATATAKVTNKGTINVSGTLTEGADGALVQDDDNARINAMSKDAVIALENTAKLADGYIMILRNENVTGEATDEPIAYNLTSATDTAPTKANTIFVNCVLNATQLGTINSKNLIVYKNINLESNVTIEGDFIVAGNVQIINGTDKKSNAVTLTLTKDEDNTIKDGATLKLDTNVTINGSAEGTNLKIEGTGSYTPNGGSKGDKLTIG